MDIEAEGTSRGPYIAQTRQMFSLNFDTFSGVGIQALIISRFDFAQIVGLDVGPFEINLQDLN